MTEAFIVSQGYHFEYQWLLQYYPCCGSYGICLKWISILFDLTFKISYFFIPVVLNTPPPLFLKPGTRLECNEHSEFSTLRTLPHTHYHAHIHSSTLTCSLLSCTLYLQFQKHKQTNIPAHPCILEMGKPLEGHLPCVSSFAYFYVPVTECCLF